MELLEFVMELDISYAPEKYHAICNGIRYLISLILLIEKILALDDALMLIKSLLNKDKNHYY